MRRPTAAAMRWQMFARCCVSRNLTLDSTTLPLPFDEGLGRSVHHDVVDGVVLEQRLERAEAEDVVHQLAGQRVLLARVELDAAIGGDFGQQALDVDGQAFRRHRGDRGRLQPRQAEVAQLDDGVGRQAGAGRLGIADGRRRRGGAASATGGGGRSRWH